MEINLNRLLSLLLSKLKYIILVAIIIAIGAFAYTKLFISEKYTSSAKFLVDMEVTQNKASEQSFAVNALGSYMEIFDTRDFFEEVAGIYNQDNAENVLSSSQIRSMTSISDSSSAEKPTFYIRVSSGDPIEAYKLAKTISEYAVVKINEFEYLNSITMIEKPIKPLSPSSPNTKKNTLLGFVIGAVITCAFFVCIEMFDGRVKSIEDISSQYEIPVLGVVPDSSTDSSSKKNSKLKKKHSSDYEQEKK